MIGIKNTKRTKLVQSLLEFCHEEHSNTEITRIPMVEFIKNFIKTNEPHWAHYQYIYDKCSVDWFAWIQQGRTHIINCPLFDKIIADRLTSKFTLYNWRMYFDGTGYKVQRQHSKGCHWQDYNEKYLSAKKAWRFMIASMVAVKAEEIALEIPTIRSDLTLLNTSIDRRMLTFVGGTLHYQWHSDFTRYIVDMEDVESEVSSMLSTIFQMNLANIK